MQPIHPSPVGEVLFADWLTNLLVIAERSLQQATATAIAAATLTAAAPAKSNNSNTGNRVTGKSSKASAMTADEDGVAKRVGAVRVDAQTRMPRKPLSEGADSVFVMRCYGLLEGAVFGEMSATPLKVMNSSSGWEFVEYEVRTCIFRLSGTQICCQAYICDKLYKTWCDSVYYS
jgi:hypothetical protein